MIKQKAITGSRCRCFAALDTDKLNCVQCAFTDVCAILYPAF